ncbi:hypothetical protein [Clostridium sp. OS1-26]|uniref:hypothetical protein n=1 Tax=Clostridium sp. OS1-26 TaxID=3070681 RepID=UPI0027E1B8A4|nr:hypothetical protein [Clostridium sp. OS1-26]WML35061.1 hypothetical protein RCG18_28125 [Clostridium sp. OS1-26]
MSRSKNNTDKLVDLLFYVLPQYMDEYNNQNHRKREGLRDDEREGLRDEGIEGFRDEIKEEIFKKFKSLAFNDDKHNAKSEHKEGNAKKVQGNHQVSKNNADDDKHNVKSEHKENNVKKVQDNHKLRENNIDRNNIEEKHTEDGDQKCNKFNNECKDCKNCNVKKIQDNHQLRKNNTERNVIKEDTEDGNHKFNKFDEDKKRSDLNLSNNEKTPNKETGDKFIKENYIYNDKAQFKEILKLLINKRINIVISDPIRSIIYNVIILEVSSDIVKLKTEVNTIIILCIKEIVAIQCDEKDYIAFVKNVYFNKKEHYDGGELQNYLYTIIGKRVFIQTKGNADFRHINCKKITAVGEGFVVIEDSIIISLYKIILVEEVECYKEDS